jgi:hypothetical protein
MVTNSSSDAGCPGEDGGGAVGAIPRPSVQKGSCYATPRQVLLLLAGLGGEVFPGYCAVCRRRHGTPRRISGWPAEMARLVPGIEAPESQCVCRRCLRNPTVKSVLADGIE